MAAKRQQSVLKPAGRPTQATKQSGRRTRPARRGRTTQAAREVVNLRDALFDQARLATQTYLTIPELCAYGRFQTENAAYLFLLRHEREVPKVRQGRTIQVMRRDYDRFVQSPRGTSGDTKPVRERHAGQSAVTAAGEQR